MKILFTGASSFTGYWFVRELVSRGHEVICCQQKADLDDYSGLARARLDELKKVARLCFASPFGEDNFLRELSQGNYKLICHHGADVTNYKSPDFDFIRATEKNTRQIRKVFKAAESLQRCVLTSSVFESGLGLGEEPLRAFSPYGLSKTLTREVFQYYCEIEQVGLGIFVIPNPFGIFEEKRFTQYLVQNWSEGKVPEVNTPEYVRDNIPVDLLAMAYANFVELKTADPNFCAPQGYVESQGRFAERCAEEFSRRLGIKFSVKLNEQKSFDEPRMRVNSKPARLIVPNWSEKSFWDGYVEYYREMLFRNASKS